MNCPMAAEAGTTTVVFAENWGALLKYPASLRVNLVEERYGHRNSTCYPVSTKKAKKLKSRKLNSGEQLQNKYHLEVYDPAIIASPQNKIREKLLKCYSKVIDVARGLHYFPVQHSTSTDARADVDFAAMCNLASLATEYEGAPIILQNDTHRQEHNDVFGRIVSNICDQELNLTILGREFVIPPRSTFLLSNLCQINPLYNFTACNGKYDLIVIDPPWENRSAIRGRKYEWLPTERLLELSIQRLAAKGALVAVWVTNKRKLTMFIRQKLFPKWNICYQAEWHWLKFTTGGDLIHEMDSVHKKPYEVVVIGHYMETSSNCSDSTPPPKRICLESSDSNLKTYNEFDGDQFTEPQSGIRNSAYSYSPPNDVESCTEKRLIRESSSHEEPVHPEIIKNFVFACVASQTHSQKPYLGDILDKYCTKQGRKLELFARNLLPGWTSWGNEVLLFQEKVQATVSTKNTGV